MINEVSRQQLSHQSESLCHKSQYPAYPNRSSLQSSDLFRSVLEHVFNLGAFLVFSIIYYAWTTHNILRFLFSVSSRSERMVNLTSGHFAYRIRSGLQARDFWSFSLISLFNLTSLTIFCIIYYAWAALLTIETNYWILLTFAVLVLLAIEHIAVTYTIEQIESGRTSFLVKLTSWDWKTAENPWAAHIRVAVVLILSLGIGVVAVRSVDNLRRNIISINPDGTATIFVTVGKSRLGLQNQVFATISGASEKALYCVPVQIEGPNWIVEIKDKNFSDSSESWRIEFYIKPQTQPTPIMPTVPEVTCVAKREDLRITEISYKP